jgi:hypothetical protein
MFDKAEATARGLALGWPGLLLYVEILFPLFIGVGGIERWRRGVDTDCGGV